MYSPDDFDYGQIDDISDGDYIFDDEVMEVTNYPLQGTHRPIPGKVRPLTKEDYADIFLENYD